MAEYTEKRVLEQTSCPNESCGSSDAFTIYEKGQKKDGYCFSCGYSTFDPYGDLNSHTKDIPNVGESVGNVTNNTSHSTPYDSVLQQGGGQRLSVEDGLSHPVRALPDRMISYSTAEHFGVRVGVSTTDGETPIYTLFPQHRKGDLVGWKQKTTDKKYLSTGGSNLDLFGAHLVRPQGKKLFITEGELDALALYQVLKENSTIVGWEPPVVSLPNGSKSVVKAIALNQELLDSYEEIILVFDNDEAGKEARDAACKALAGKVSYVTTPLKDSNDMLLEGRGNELKWLALSHAKKYQPDGIVNAKDLWERYKSSDNKICYPYPDYMPTLNEKTYGVRPGSIITITSGSGCGKTQYMRELMYHYYLKTDENIAGLYLEEDVTETLSGMLSLDLNKRITLPDVEVSLDDERESYNRIFGSGRISLYDYFGGMDDSSLLSKLRYFAVTGHRFIFLDHLSIVVSEYAAEGGERERIDTLMTKLAKFVKEFGIVLFLVVHLRKADSSGTPFELGAVPSLDDLRGSATLKQLSWDVLGLSRNQQHKNELCAHTTEVSVLKCRFTGRTGVADYLHFNQDTGRLNLIDKPNDYREQKRFKSV